MQQTFFYYNYENYLLTFLTIVTSVLDLTDSPLLGKGSSRLCYLHTPMTPTSASRSLIPVILMSKSRS
ncbi:hypothetical protein CT0218 [Chlorobaculum tepidum TLS]|uniref:Uncharacterized protein n=1 Tax=Chlorobaculum tepidum (strain ATCC 49652 / DSM 12025 / NBRC 103806 / TLS) TaxID=194439 RepID=Q8KFV3_CHLTE|nr:hypothetical protein CT0218 [Chlorobaculum tepidum TLS]